MSSCCVVVYVYGTSHTYTQPRSRMAAFPEKKMNRLLKAITELVQKHNPTTASHPITPKYGPYLHPRDQQNRNWRVVGLWTMVIASEEKSTDIQELSVDDLCEIMATRPVSEVYSYMLGQLSDKMFGAGGTHHMTFVLPLEDGSELLIHN